MGANFKRTYFQAGSNRNGAKRRSSSTVPHTESRKNKPNTFRKKLFKLVPVLLISSLFYAPNANAVLIVANDPNFLNKINAGLNATLEIFELVELVS